MMGGAMTRGDGGSQRERERSEGRGEEGREGALKKVSDSPQHPDQTPTGAEKVWRFTPRTRGRLQTSRIVRKCSRMRRKAKK